MFGWFGFCVGEYFFVCYGVFVVVDNDVNFVVFGEYCECFGYIGYSIIVKVGMVIGSGIIVDGYVYCGVMFVVGDIIYICIDGSGDIFCFCGNMGCFEMVVSGVSFVWQMCECGNESVWVIIDVFVFVCDVDFFVIIFVWIVGIYFGQVLFGVVNFFNLYVVFFIGSMSVLELFIVVVCSCVYEVCYLFVIQWLCIELVVMGVDVIFFGVV